MLFETSSFSKTFFETMPREAKTRKSSQFEQRKKDSVRTFHKKPPTMNFESIENC